MKKKLLTFLLTTVLCFTFLPVANAQDSIGVIINGREISFDVKPQIANGRTLVPMRKIFEKMGATVTYDAKSQTITATKASKTIIMKINSKSISVSGKKFDLDVAPTIIGSRTLVPVRAVSESLNATVEWNDFSKKVIIFDWDSMTKIVGYESAPQIPDFGKYVGLESTFAQPLAESYNAKIQHTYANQLGSNASKILEDFRKVLASNGFVSDEAGLYETFSINPEDETTYHAITLPTTLYDDVDGTIDVVIAYPYDGEMF